jgi:hypothetical protein
MVQLQLVDEIIIASIHVVNETAAAVRDNEVVAAGRADGAVATSIADEIVVTVRDDETVVDVNHCGLEFYMFHREIILLNTVVLGPKNSPKRRVSRFSTICAKNQVLKINIDKAT